MICQIPEDSAALGAAEVRGKVAEAVAWGGAAVVAVADRAWVPADSVSAPVAEPQHPISRALPATV
jgi:hypothetical protein